jgi:hypothetical protein
MIELYAQDAATGSKVRGESERAGAEAKSGSPDFVKLSTNQL